MQRLFLRGIEMLDNQATLAGVGLKSGDVVWLLEIDAVAGSDDEVQMVSAPNKKPRGPERAGFVGSILGGAADVSAAKSASPAIPPLTQSPTMEVDARDDLEDGMVRGGQSEELRNKRESRG